MSFYCRFIILEKIIKLWIVDNVEKVYTVYTLYPHVHNFDMPDLLSLIH